MYLFFQIRFINTLPGFGPPNPTFTSIDLTNFLLHCTPRAHGPLATDARRSSASDATRRDNLYLALACFALNAIFNAIFNAIYISFVLFDLAIIVTLIIAIKKIFLSKN